MTVTGETHRMKVIGSALKDGRISPEEVLAWGEKYDRDPDGTAAELQALTPMKLLLAAFGGRPWRAR